MTFLSLASSLFPPYGGGGGLVAKLYLTLETPWTVACQAPPCMGSPKQEYWSGLPFPSPGDLPDPGIEPETPELQSDALPSEPPGKPVPIAQPERILDTQS